MKRKIERAKKKLNEQSSGPRFSADALESAVEEAKRTIDRLKDNVDEPKDMVVIGQIAGFINLLGRKLKDADLDDKYRNELQSIVDAADEVEEDFIGGRAFVANYELRE